MSISKPAPPPKKKSGCGCFGCGCAVLVALLILVIALIVGGSYVGVQNQKISTPAPADIPTPVTTDKSFAAVQEKMDTFQQGVKKHEPASIHLTAEDINNLIVHTPDLAQRNIRAFVSITNDIGRLEASVPTSALTNNAIKDRYLNFNVTFGVNFDEKAHMINLLPHTLQVGDQALIGGESTSTTSSGGSTTSAITSALTPFLNQAFNTSLRKNPDMDAFLDHAKTVEIKNNELVIESQ